MCNGMSVGDARGVLLEVINNFHPCVKLKRDDCCREPPEQKTSRDRFANTVDYKTSGTLSGRTIGLKGEGLKPMSQAAHPRSDNRAGHFARLTRARACSDRCAADHLPRRRHTDRASRPSRQTRAFRDEFAIGRGSKANIIGMAHVITRGHDGAPTQDKSRGREDPAVEIDRVW
ncbi:hypothetical protein BDY21DRAFT_360401 [Lineolata rhizophorae]|uniref:Uncharacterized protein n=1 Tax=Lineolata rhizophorae TaxID=578093 RepID=A0A6A6PCU2_9PEZI|nr:hypothetical protein BDY21DRAFT_360401 [Lineolata rhizophorae]